MFAESELLPLSGLQHLAFCERQWALIHVEQAWDENSLTARGRVLHNRVHEQTEETRHELLITRGLPVRSLRLGLSGKADVVEFKRAADDALTTATEIPDKSGLWTPEPVEYKRGRAKRDPCDRVQLCAQALCLEEMFRIEIVQGALFYGATRRRTTVAFTPELRSQTEALAARMHDLFAHSVTPPAVLIPGCKSCSLRERCQPETLSKPVSAERYVRRALREIA